MSWEWRMMQNLKRTWLGNSKLTWGIWRTEHSKISYICTFILESKMAELNQNKNSKQPDLPDAV